MDTDRAAPVLAQVGDVDHGARNEDIGVAVKIADALAVRENARLVLGGAW